MIYSTGTISINGNTATGSGTNWTAPASQVRAGQTIIVMSNPVQMFQISSVNSATSMTVTPAASPALSGQKYGILVSDVISVDGLAQAMSHLINEYDENIGAWETFATTSANQNITVTINGKPVTIPGIGGLARKGVNSDITELKGLTTALSVAQGGTGATKAEDARTNLGLGSSATKDYGNAPGNVMVWGPGILDSSRNSDASIFGLMSQTGCGVYRFNAEQSGNIARYSCGFYANSNDTHAFIQVDYATGNVMAWGGLGTASSGISLKSNTLYGTSNTTKASDGTLKAASPIVKVFSDGTFETNEESEGVTVKRLGVGQYLIEGCQGLNSDAAWGGIDGGFDIPTDRNKQPLLWLDYEVSPDGSVLVKTFHRTYPAAPVFARNELNGVSEGEPVDIPHDQFVSARVQMPMDSAYNRKQIVWAMAAEA